MNIRYVTVAFFLLGLQGCFSDPGFPEDSRIIDGGDGNYPGASGGYVSAIP